MTSNDANFPARYPPGGPEPVVIGNNETMSDVYDHADVSLMMADYAVTDQSNKLQVVGGGLQVVARNHAKKMSHAFALVISMVFTPDVINEQYAFEVVLENADGSPAQLGGTNPDGTPKVMRFGQNLQVEEPNYRGVIVPRHTLPPRAQMVLYFNNGLPLPAGQGLAWRARIDTDTKPHWVLPFFVPAPPAGPVLG